MCSIVEICNTFEHRHKPVSYCLGCTLHSPGYPTVILNTLNFYGKSTTDTMRVDPENTWRNWRRNQWQYRIACMIVLHMTLVRVSDCSDNGLTPLQEQDEQPEVVNSAENAIEHDAIDILTEYPPWSIDTYDICDDDEVIYDRNRKETQDELYKDTPVKTENNKSYVDNVDIYNRDRALITQSHSDRLGLGQNSLPGAKHVRGATKHTDQMTDIPDHLRLISLGEETKYKLQRNR